MERKVIVLSGLDRLRLLQAVVECTWLKPSGVVGLAVDNLDAMWLSLRFGEPMAGRILVRYRELGGCVLGTGADGGDKGQVRRRR